MDRVVARWLPGLVVALVLPLASCANSTWGEAVQGSLAADPKLQETIPAPTPAATGETGAAGGQPDAPSEPTPSPDPTLGATSPIPTPSPTVGGASTPANLGLAGSVGGDEASPDSTGTAPSPVTGNLSLGGSTDGSLEAPEGSANPNPGLVFADLNQAPQELQPKIADLAQLGVLPLIANSKQKSLEPGTEKFQPNKPVARREFARWLFLANNRLFHDRPAQQIRPAAPTTPPAFRDVPSRDPDFAIIQGLAEAGLIPSSLSGNPTATTFRPDAQLSRETLVLWKVPVDLRQPLPAATLAAIQQTWGFQDANRIDPSAQRAVLADYQNADLANIRRVFGYTTLFQPKKPVTRAEATASLWYFGYQGDGRSAKEALADSAQQN
jgi:hypothetical protein